MKIVVKYGAGGSNESRKSGCRGIGGDIWVSFYFFVLDIFPLAVSDLVA